MVKPKIKEGHISELTFDPNNARKRTQTSAGIIRRSLEQFGGCRSIVVDENNTVRAGNGTLEEAGQLGIEKVIIVEASGNELVAVKRSGLTEEQWKRYAIADNTASDFSTWDFDVLNDLAQEVDLSEFFPDDKLNELLEQFGKGEGFGVTEPKEEDEEEVAELLDKVDEIESRVKLGDIWSLGRHKLCCGDSTTEKNVRALLGDRFDDVGMVWADPPYNIDYQGVSDKREKIANDKMPDSQFVDFLSKAIFPASTIYCCCSWQYAHLFREALIRINRKPKAMIVWDKINPAQHLDKYFKQHELIFYYGEFGGSKTLRGDIWQLARQRNTVHPTMKPIELLEIAYADQPDIDLIYDPFLGSAPSIIAAEKMEGDRTVYGFELSPQYCTIILERFQRFTGIEPKLIGKLPN